MLVSTSSLDCGRCVWVKEASTLANADGSPLFPWRYGRIDFFQKLYESLHRRVDAWGRNIGCENHNVACALQLRQDAYKPPCFQIVGDIPQGPQRDTHARDCKLAYDLAAVGPHMAFPFDQHRPIRAAQPPRHLPERGKQPMPFAAELTGSIC